MTLSDIKGVSPARLRALNENGIRSVKDLISFFPRTWLDRTTVKPIAHLKGNDEQVTLIGKVTSVQEAGFGKRKRLEAVVQDDSGVIKCVWFKGLAYFKKFIKPGEMVSVYGRVKRFGRYLSMAHPEMDKISKENELKRSAGIVPIYPSNNFFKKTYITSVILQDWMKQITGQVRFEEFMPDYLLKDFGFPEINEAYRRIHLPSEPGEYQPALQRFKFEELFLFELSVHKLKLQHTKKNKGPCIPEPGDLTKSFFTKELPFQLTEGQKNALRDIRKDLAAGIQMNRLIQGDVGSGKTVVAIGAMLMCIDHGYQAAFMAPTEILAEQHYRTLDSFLKPLGINIRLLTGQQKSALRRDVLSDISGGTAQIVVGTHAIIQDQVSFNRLGIAIIDEQHRFGVMQRSVFLQKGLNPHILVMSATPIPRSLALTLYGDLNISVIKGLPSGRKPIKTALRGENKREDVYAFTESVLREGGQVYIVYPLIEESEALDLKNATEGYEQVCRRFSDFSVGLLHGRMKTEEKDEVMRDFISKKYQVLVSTTVIEVGVDVPNASVMIIEHAERFGLSQLHQLRGRIGRGSRQSFCILMADYKQSKEARFRLQTMVRTQDGFEISEADLKLRGPGDFLGTRQSGLPDFKHADIIQDQALLEQATETANSIINDDPDLEKPGHKTLKPVFEAYLKERGKFFSTG